MFSFIKFLQGFLQKIKRNKGLWFTTLAVLSIFGIGVRRIKALGVECDRLPQSHLCFDVICPLFQQLAFQIDWITVAVFCGDASLGVIKHQTTVMLGVSLILQPRSDGVAASVISPIGDT